MCEAIRLLSNAGLFSYRPSRRSFVAGASLEEINDYLRVQGALEALAVEWACSWATDQEITSIVGLNTSVNEAGNNQEKLLAFQFDMQFHKEIVDAARNKAFADTHATYNARLSRVRFLSSQRQEGRLETRLELLNIIESLRARDHSATAAAFKQHRRTAENNFAPVLGERERAA